MSTYQSNPSVPAVPAQAAVPAMPKDQAPLPEVIRHGDQAPASMCEWEAIHWDGSQAVLDLAHARGVDVLYRDGARDLLRQMVRFDGEEETAERLAMAMGTGADREEVQQALRAFIAMPQPGDLVWWEDPDQSEDACSCAGTVKRVNGGIVTVGTPMGGITEAPVSEVIEVTKEGAALRSALMILSRIQGDLDRQKMGSGIDDALSAAIQVLRHGIDAQE